MIVRRISIQISKNLSKTFNKNLGIISAKIPYQQFKNKQYNIPKIFQVMNFKYNNNQNQQEMKQIYFNNMCSKKSMKQKSFKDYLLLQQKYLQYNIMDFNLELLQNRNKFTLIQQQFIDNIFIFWGQMYINILQRGHVISDCIGEKKLVTLYLKYVLLCSRSKEIILIYITLMNKLLFYFNISKNKQITPIRIICDIMLQHKYCRNQLYFLLPFISRISIQVIYYQRGKEIVQYLLQMLPQKWYQQIHWKGILRSTLSFSTTLPSIMKDYKYILNNVKNHEKIKWALICLVEKKQLTFQDLSIQNYKKTITQLVIYDKYKMYKTTIRTFYRGSLWFKQYWLPFFNWLIQSKQNNYTKLQKYDLFVIFRLLQIDKDLIDDKIISIGKQCQKKLLQNYNFSIHQINLYKQYQILYPQNSQKKVTCQTQLANNLRTICSSRQVLTQKLIEFFIVDILVDNHIIVEVNSKIHYIQFTDQQNKLLTLKTQFRTRILQKIGYKVIHIDVFDYSEGTFEFIDKIIQVQNNLKVITKQQNIIQN